MTLALLFWIVYVIGLFFGYGVADRTRPYWFGYPLVVAVLFFLLGWQVFGFLVRR